MAVAVQQYLEVLAEKYFFECEFYQKIITQLYKIGEWRRLARKLHLHRVVGLYCLTFNAPFS